MMKKIALRLYIQSGGKGLDASHLASTADIRGGGEVEKFFRGGG
jgi:hypothetical protein